MADAELSSYSLTGPKSVDAIYFLVIARGQNVKTFTLELIQEANRALNVLTNQGFTVENSFDQAQISKFQDAIGKGYMTKVLDPLNNDFTGANSIWQLVKFKGEAVAMGGARMDDLGDESLLDFLPRSISRQYAKDNRIQSVSPLLREVTGKVVYLGDMYAAKAFRGSVDNLKAAVQLFQITLILNWNPDWMYSFLRERDVNRGLRRSIIIPASIRIRINLWTLCRRDQIQSVFAE